MSEIGQDEFLGKLFFCLFEKGMSMHAALKSVSADNSGNSISALAEEMAKQVWEGYSLVPVMEQHGDFFSRGRIEAFKNFETTGALGPELAALVKK